MKVYLVRHTSVVWDGNQICYGNTDVDVNPTFEEEAEPTKKMLSSLSFDAVFTSPLKRAVKLADYCGFAEAVRDDRLKEMNFGDWEGQTWAQIIPKGKSINDFFDYFIEHQIPNGESLQMQQKRVVEFLEEKKRLGLKSILIFCHGGVINCSRAYVGEMSLREAFEFLPPFASVNSLEM
ncbi:alpha-ribazole phosphatase family protein [Falsiporphyromonas endometrii]|uniref:phosphoglycerate mutase (2,3-diphosphoglycerate-dependent) n=1 Tax=Falsiporphyromonas endometrii TaxID=1387297 RepID=A0ABV9K532_9PORP